MNSLFAERFKSARLMNGFSLQDLADNIGNKISRQALHKYEKGTTMPDSEMMGFLCEALNVRPDYFFREEGVELGEIEFRKLKKLPVKEENRILELAKDHLARYIELEKILNIATVFINPIEEFPAIQNSEDVENAAALLRKAWEMGNDAIANVMELLEDKHIKIIYVEAGDEYDGMQTIIKGSNIPVIAINVSRIKKDDRKRFTALHELAHLILKIPETFSDKEKENFCHQFAGAMLFPADAVRKELGDKRMRIHVQELGALKKQYGISMQAIIMRAKVLKIISDSTCRQLFMLFRQMNWRIEEPVNYEGNESANRFDQLLYRALAEEIISVSKAAALKNMKVAEFHKQSSSMI